MSFTNLNRRFRTATEFAAWLATLPRPTWGVIGSTYHNTYRPNEDQWQGRASMASMQLTYEQKTPVPWTTGPHCYLAAGTAFDGIFVMCPPTQEAIHGVACNADHFGIEVVGDFQTRPMSAAQTRLLLDTVEALHRWAQIGPRLNAHRDCVVRTCPGDAAYAQKSGLQAELVRRFAAPLDPFAAWGPTARPWGVATGFAIPRMWLRNVVRCGECRSPEISVGEGASAMQRFQDAILSWDKASNDVHVLPVPHIP